MPSNITLMPAPQSQNTNRPIRIKNKQQQLQCHNHSKLKSTGITSYNGTHCSNHITQMQIRIKLIWGILSFLEVIFMLSMSL